MTWHVALMKSRWKITGGLIALAIVGAAILFRSDRSEQEALEETRRELRRLGFRIDLTEFSCSTSRELRARAGALTIIGHAVQAHSPDNLILLTPVGSNAAAVVWKQDKLAGRDGEDMWPILRESLRESRALYENRPDLDAACEAALSGPIRFDVNTSAGHNMLLPHLEALKRLAQTLGARAVVELHDGNNDAAWTNLLAATRLATAWDPEPAEVSHLVRYACATTAYDVTWQALQAGGWTDEQLERLQREWESVDFFKGLPETAAFTRASAVATCQLERQQLLTFFMMLKQTLRAPRYAWDRLTDYWRQLRYRHHGTYEDEKALLLHCRDRELELRRAIQSPTWSQMRQFPGTTNMIPFQSKYPSRMQTMMNMRQILLASQLYAQGQGQGFLGRAADAEAHRRIIIAVTALERYHLRHGSYPNTLQELLPEWLRNPPSDFMDGNPLRYHRTDDGHFVLYSVGLDCVDNGGEMSRPRRAGAPGEVAGAFGMQQAVDLVWPLPASVAAVRSQE